MSTPHLLSLRDTECNVYSAMNCGETHTKIFYANILTNTQKHKNLNTDSRTIIIKLQNGLCSSSYINSIVLTEMSLRCVIFAVLQTTTSSNRNRILILLLLLYPLNRNIW